MNPLQWALWDNHSDTIKLINDLKEAIGGGQLSADSPVMLSADKKIPIEEVPTAFANMPHDLGSPEGTMPHQSPFYVEREADHEAVSALNDIRGVTITIKGPR